MTSSGSPLLSVKNLKIAIREKNAFSTVVRGVSFCINHGETLGLVGASGSGKSLTALSLVQLLPGGLLVEGEAFLERKDFRKRDLLHLNATGIQQVRGREVGFVFQEPGSAMNPVYTCGEQIKEILQIHGIAFGLEAEKQSLEWLDRVGLVDVRRIYKSYPHQVSGGQLQRVMIAMAICTNPVLLIADEPTTSLDVHIQSHILQLLNSLKKEMGLAMLFISHDLGVISEVADQVAIMEEGQIVEQNSVTNIFFAPTHPATKSLLWSRAPLHQKLHRLPFDGVEIPMPDVPDLPKTETSRPLLRVDDLNLSYNKKNAFSRKKMFTKAVDGVSFKIDKGKTLGIAGASGSGKTSLGKCIVKLLEPQSGSIIFLDKSIGALNKTDFQMYRKSAQYIFQDPYNALNPIMEVGESIREVIRHWQPELTLVEQRDKALYFLRLVGLEEAHYHRYPATFSGGQRQRVCIARALAVEPELIVCDEVVSALDTSIQAQILNLLKDLQEQFNLTYLFISHDLAVLRFMADELLVMRDGKVVEGGFAETIFNQPATDYTRELLEAVPGKRFL